MKQNTILTLFAILMATASVVKAEAIKVNFDGGKAGGMSFVDLVKTADLCQNDKSACDKSVSAPEKIEGKTLSANAAGRNIIEADKFGEPVGIYSEDGIKREGVRIKRIIKARVSGLGEFQWAVGSDEQLYAMGMARPLPEFDTAKSMYLTDALALFENAEAAPATRDSCKESQTSNCTAGEKYLCTHNICYRCWLEWVTNSHGESVQKTVCGWQTDSIDCQPTGIPCK